MNWLTRIAITLALLPFAACWASATPLNAQSLFSATGWQVVRFTDDGGVVVVEGREVSFVTLQTSALILDEEKWLAAVVRFPALEMTPKTLAQVLAGGECACSQPPVLIVSNEAGTKSYSALIDTDIVASDRVLALEQGNFLGSGAELSISLAAHFCDASRREHTTAERRYIFGFPKLERLAALDGHLIVRTPDVLKQARNKVSAVTTPEGKRGLAYTKHGEGQTLLLHSGSPIEERLSKPNTAAATAGIPLSDEQSPSTFRGRVVDERGYPLTGIRVEYGSKRSGLWTLLGPIDRGSDITDSEGRFEAPTGDGLIIVIEADGFEEIRENFHPAKYNYQLRNMNSKPVTDEVTDFLLLDKNAKIDVWDSGDLIQKLVGQRPGSFELGIKFYPSRKENENNPLDVTILADIVFEFRRLCEPDAPEAKTDDCQWEIVIRGQNGWELTPTEPDLSYTAIMRATDSGYKQKWIFTNKTVPMNFYLCKDGGKRYGVLGDVQYYKTRQHGWNFVSGYLVQAEPVGTRSLVHEHRPFAHFYKSRQPSEQPTSSSTD